MNIAFIHDVFPSGGAERVTIDIATYLADCGKNYNVYVYCHSITPELLTDELHKYMTIRHMNVTSNVEKSKYIERLILSDKIDIVVQVVHRLYDIEGIKMRTGVKVVMANHGEPFWQRFRFITKAQKRNPVAWVLYKKFWYLYCGHAMRKAVKSTRTNYDSCDAYVVLCDAYKELLCRRLKLNMAESHMFVIGNSEKPVNDVCYDKENVIMYCGRLYNGTKALDALLRIWKRIQDKIPDWKLVLVGDGPDRPLLEKQISKDKIDRVIFAGWSADVASYYRKASIVCLTSRTESWGLALTEAQAHGAIPVSFGCSDGVRSILSPSGENGFIVTPGDESEFARTLLHIISMSEEDKMRIRKNVVRKSFDYSPEQVGSLWSELFDNLVKS